MKLSTGVLVSTISLLFAIPAFAQSITVNLKISPAGSFQATTSKVNGKVKIAGGNVQATKITVPLSTLGTKMKLRDEHMKDKYLEVSKFPTAELTMGEGKGGTGKAKLKIRGIEKEVTGTYKVKGKSVEATFAINLSDYNITGIRYMGAGVKDKAEIVAVVPAE